MPRTSVFVRLVGRALRGAAIFGALLAVLVPACGGKSVRSGDGSDDSTEPGDDGDGPHGGRGGSSGESRGGTGGGVTATGGVADQSDPQCQGVRTHLVCVFEGKQCADVACGIADSGRSQCTCATYWQCTMCDYTNSPFRDRPASVPRCLPEVADEGYCDEENALCSRKGGVEEYCACYRDPTGGLIWDCTAPPSTWR
jgi:hypothetical protein